MGLGARFWLRLSWRDLRRRWQVIVAIGLLLGGGVGLAAGLGSMREWRIESNDASFDALNAHDLRVEVEEGAFAPAGALATAASSIPDAAEISAASERLILPTQISARSRWGEAVLTPGRLIGVELDRSGSRRGVETTGPEVDTIAVDAGEGLGKEAGASVGVAGAGAMALAPLLTVRRLRRMDVSSTLRVLE